MSLCEYICVFVIYVCVSMFIVYVCVCSLCLYIYVCTCLCLYMCMCVYISMCVLHLCVYVCIVCVCLYMCIVCVSVSVSLSSLSSLSPSLCHACPWLLAFFLLQPLTFLGCSQTAGPTPARAPVVGQEVKVQLQPMSGQCRAGVTPKRDKVTAVLACCSPPPGAWSREGRGWGQGAGQCLGGDGRG